ncbi:MAG TPA: glycosyltransferase family 2 protein [Candidatus Xenobia bacterium]|nr:glycosyltransferase family 2 protein [Candidatus Xenobia bacterium]
MPPPRIALVIPALNEEQAIAQVLDGLPRRLFARVVVVDNGSTDATAAGARAHGAEVVPEPRRGYGQACLAGLAALGRDPDVIVFMDGDGSDLPAEVELLLEPIRRNEADLVIGSRALGKAEPGSLTWAQRWGNRLSVALIRLLFGHRYTDLGPFRAIRRESLEALAMRDTNFGWTVEMQVKAVKHGLRVQEVPVSYRPRLGHSKISGTVSGVLRAGTKIIWTILRWKFS